MKIVNFRVDETEHKLIQAICESAGHTMSSYIRAHFKTKAVELGITVDPLAELRVSVQKETPQAQPNKPQVIRVPIPTEPNAWREEILHRHKGGELLTSIADSYGMPLAVVRSKLHDAKTAELEGASLNLDELPEYNPADPDNPTLAEQKINADRARAQLEKLGFNV
jgi:antitoxin component of RelBE/YafQ-DinJ toxin-antitoxin module